MTAQSRHHSLDYVELTVTDLAAAKAFYTEAFGWRLVDYGPECAGIASPTDDGAEVGGLLAAPEPRPNGGPFVLLYSEDLEETQRRARFGLPVRMISDRPTGGWDLRQRWVRTVPDAHQWVLGHRS